MPSTLEFHLSFNNGADRLQLPVNPAAIRITSTRGYDDVEVTQLGEYTVIGNEKLRELSFSSFFPRDYNPSYCEYADIAEPWEIAGLIEAWIASRKPIRLTIPGVLNMPVTIRSFSYEERAGHVGDLFYDISLKEYRFIEFKRLSTVATNADGTEVVSVMGPLERPDDSDKPTEYTVASGDSLFKIAAKADVYADGDQWRKLYDANKAAIGANPNLIYVGQTLVIPR